MKKNKITFLELFNRFILFYKSENCEDYKAPGTIKNYSKKHKIISAWMHRNTLQQLPPEEFKISLAKQLLRDLLLTHNRNYSVRMVKMVSQVLTWGASEELMESNPLLALKLKREYKKNIIHLTPDELVQIETHFFCSPYINRIKDMFLFQCYTGLDYGDTMTVCKEHLYQNPKDGRFYIVKNRDKNTNPHTALVPYFNKTKSIWEKYNCKFPTIANSTYNRILKEIMHLIGIEKRITTHTGRKTFAMIALNNEGYSIAAVSKMLGHKTIRTTEDYYTQVNFDLISSELDRRKIA